MSRNPFAVPSHCGSAEHDAARAEVREQPRHLHEDRRRCDGVGGAGPIHGRAERLAGEQALDDGPRERRKLQPAYVVIHVTVREQAHVSSRRRIGVLFRRR